MFDLKSSNRIRLTSYISPDLDDLIQDYMDQNNISTKSQALERILIEFRYMKNEVEFLRTIISNGGIKPQDNFAPVKIDREKKNIDRVKSSIDDIFMNMPD